MAKFTRNGFDIEYPNEWEAEYDENQYHEVTFYSPNGAFWTLTRRPGYVDPTNLLQEAVETLTGEYEEAEVSTALEVYQDRRLEGFDIDFFYLDLPCLAMLRTIRFGGFTYLIYIQTMDQNASMLEELKEMNRYWTEALKEEEI